MAPEIIEMIANNKANDIRENLDHEKSEIWTLGLVALECALNLTLRR